MGYKLPSLIRDFFHSEANFSITIKMADLGTTLSGSTTPNLVSNNLEVKLNSYFSEATDLSNAATILHEGFHCQLMNWYRQAVVENNQALKEELARDYGYLFTEEYIQSDSNLIRIVQGGNPTHHVDIVNRYLNTIGDALYAFAQARNISANLAYCRDLAWAGSTDGTSEAFDKLPLSARNRIKDALAVEKDPSGTKGVNTNGFLEPEGHPCQ
jgi:hypothetical protein